MSKTDPLILAVFLTLLTDPSRGEGRKGEWIEATGKTVVAGRVTNADGKPIADAHLVIWDASSEGESRHHSQTTSDGEGRFSLDALPGKGRLSVSADGYAAMCRKHDVIQGVNRGWDFVLPASAHVSGRIVDTNGKCVPNRLLKLWPIEGGPPPAPGVSFLPVDRRDWHPTDTNGVFDLPGVSPGKYSILVYESSPLGHSCLQQTPVGGKYLDVKPGERVERFEIQVNPSEDYAISGHVRDARGKPVPSMDLSIHVNYCYFWATQTDRNGAFCIGGLDGTGMSLFRINFAVPGAGVYKVAIPDVPMNTKDVDFIVPDKGSIHGTVRNAKTGEMVTTYELTVPIVHLPESKAVWEEPQVKIERNPDASFSISNVPAGQATIEVRAGELGAQRFVVQVEADKTNPLQCEMLGPAVLAVQTTLNGKPTSTYVIINDKWLQSGRDGKWRFDQHPNGNYTVWFFVDERWFRSVEVHLSSGETTHLDMELGGSCEISGSVRFPEEESYCTVRLASRPSPNGWTDARPKPDEYVLAYDFVERSGGKYQLHHIPPGRYYLMAGRRLPSMARSALALSKVIEMKEGETLSVDLDLADTGERKTPD